ncbi:MAG: ribonuclease Z, partial [Treponema sp.]|nr:ribonuclease Z [Treponema sp.]
GAFSVEKAQACKVPRGPLWGKLQQGQPVTASDGTTVRPEAVLGPSRCGRKFSYVTDTLYRRSIVDAVRDSDLLICEGMFEDALIAQAREKKHMTATQAATIARDAAVRQLGLIHYSPRYTDRELSALLLEAQRIYPEAQLTKDRRCFAIPYRD